MCMNCTNVYTLLMRFNLVKLHLRKSKRKFGEKKREKKREEEEQKALENA